VKFKSTVLILPGLGNSGESHWQTLWEKAFGFQRVGQADWDTPVCSDWTASLDQFIGQQKTTDILLVGHSLACCTIVKWSSTYATKIKGALLVAPSDTEGEIYPPGTTGFNPMPLNKVPFPSIIVTSNNDPYVSLSRAKLFADSWGSQFIDIGPAGHINVASGFGEWPEGLHYLQELDNL
jgi:predicted alpha/beta hydrolase family esterase